MPVLCLFFLCGCATTQVSKNIPENNPENVAGVIFAENYGYYLFGFLPICCGNSDYPNDVSMTFFKDKVTIEKNAQMIKKEAENLGAKSIKDVRHHTMWTGGFSLWIGLEVKCNRFKIARILGFLEKNKKKSCFKKNLLHI